MLSDHTVVLNLCLKLHQQKQTHTLYSNSVNESRQKIDVVISQLSAIALFSQQTRLCDIKKLQKNSTNSKNWINSMQKEASEHRKTHMVTNTHTFQLTEAHRHTDTHTNAKIWSKTVRHSWKAAAGLFSSQTGWTELWTNYGHTSSKPASVL